jgi:hypothetical protein
VPVARLSAEEVAGLARGVAGARLRLRRPRRGSASPAPSRAVRVGDVAEVRFGVKSGCNAFFHLRPLGGGRYESALGGVARLGDGDVVPILRTLKEASAPEVAGAPFVLFRPGSDAGGRRGGGVPALGAGARSLVAAGEALGIHRRPTCASRTPWWLLAPGRGPAPVLYPAKVGARAFAFHNAAGLFEDKKWHALFPRELEPWVVAVLLSSTPVRLAVDRSARQLTGAQAIADIDCAVLADAPFPPPGALAPLARALRGLHEALARDPVSTDLAAMLDRPAQRELDLLAGFAMGLSAAAVLRQRRELLERVRERIARAGHVREAIRRRA